VEKQTLARIAAQFRDGPCACDDEQAERQMAACFACARDPTLPRFDEEQIQQSSTIDGDFLVTACSGCGQAWRKYCPVRQIKTTKYSAAVAVGAEPASNVSEAKDEMKIVDETAHYNPLLAVTDVSSDDVDDMDDGWFGSDADGEQE
jgi:hypothetical protein